MKKLFAHILAVVVLGSAHSAFAQQPTSVSQTLVGQQKPPLEKSDQLMAERIAQREYLMQHPEIRNAKNVDKNDPEFQILLAGETALSSEDLHKKNDENWKEYSQWAKNEYEDNQIGQQGAAKPPPPPPSEDEPGGGGGGGGGGSAGSPTFGGNSIVRSGPSGSRNPTGGQRNGSGSGQQNGDNGNNPGGTANGSGGNGNANNGSGSSGSGGVEVGNLAGVCQALHQLASTFYQSYKAEPNAVINTLSQIVATSSGLKADMYRLIISDLRSGKSANEIGNDMCNFCSQHWSQIQNILGNGGTTSGNQNLSFPKPTLPPQGVTQPTPVGAR